MAYNLTATATIVAVATQPIFGNPGPTGLNTTPAGYVLMTWSDGSRITTQVDLEDLGNFTPGNTITLSATVTPSVSSPTSTSTTGS